MKHTARILIFIMALIMLLPAAVSCEGGEKDALLSETDSFVFFINVGFGDSVLVKNNGKFVLIDAGDKDHTDMLFRALAAAGVDRFEAVFITNSNAAHAGGLDALSEKYEIDHVFYPMHSKLNKRGEHKIENRVKNLGLAHTAIDVTVQDTVLSAGVLFDLLGPTEYSARDNDNSLVMKAEIGGIKYLFTSDMQFAEEELIMATGADIDADIMQIPNHGNEDATSDALVQAVTPKYSILSTARNEDPNSADRRVLDAVRYDGGVYYMTEDSELGILTYMKDGEITVVKY